MKPDVIAILKELEAEATPAPWYYDCGNQNVESRDSTYFRMPIAVEENLHERIRHCKEFGLSPKADPSRCSIDMELIALVRNALPDLIAVVEAADALALAADRSLPDETFDHWPKPALVLMNALGSYRNALATLKGVKSEA